MNMTIDTTMIADGGLTTVIIPGVTHLDLEAMRLCLAALGRHTRRSWELIVVDDGSTTGLAAERIAQVPGGPVRVEVITNTVPRGFAAACHQGLAAALGDFLVLLDPNVIVTDGWLDALIALAETDPRIGLVGPLFHGGQPPQGVSAIPSTDLSGLGDFANRCRVGDRGQGFPIDRLDGSCLLVKRRVFEAVGSLAMRSTSDHAAAELCLQARRAGFRSAVACEAFVYHLATACGRAASPEPRVGAIATATRRITKIFGIGLMKTGTCSLWRALNLLGFRSLHAGNLQDLDRYDAAMDSPAASRFRELDIMYPGSVFILTVRDPAAWLASWRAHCARSGPLAFEYRSARARLFGRLDFDAESCLRGFRSHHEEVRSHFAARPADLLIMDITAGAGWETLCPFLGVPLPTTPFPWLNRRPDRPPSALARAMAGPTAAGGCR